MRGALSWDLLISEKSVSLFYPLRNQHYNSGTYLSNQLCALQGTMILRFEYFNLVRDVIRWMENKYGFMSYIFPCCHIYSIELNYLHIFKWKNQVQHVLHRIAIGYLSSIIFSSFAQEKQLEVTDGYMLEVPIDHGYPRATMHELEWESGRRVGMKLASTHSLLYCYSVVLVREGIALFFAHVRIGKM